MSSTSSLTSISEDKESIPLDDHDKDMTCDANIDPTIPMGGAAVLQALRTAKDTEQESIQGRADENSQVSGKGTWELRALTGCHNPS